MKHPICGLSPTTFRPSLLALILLGSAGLASAQTIHYVDDDAVGDPGPGNPFISDPLEAGTAANPFDRIQEAIDAAANGDEVLILDGLYFDFSTIDLSSGMGAAKSLWIHSVGGPDVTIVDATGLATRVMQAISGETSDTILEGLTLRGGDIGSAAGPDSWGAGLYVTSGGPRVIDCTFDSNTAVNGGGVYFGGGTPALVGCRFTNNLALNRGGGIYITLGATTLDDGSFEGNMAGTEGGGMFADALITLRDSVFLDNVASTTGGAIFQLNLSPRLTVERTRFVSNASSGWGGAIHCTEDVLVRDCVFNANDCPNGGSLGVTANALLLVEGSTFVGNDGYAVRRSTGSATILNSILWGNTPAELLGQVAVSYSNILGGWPGAGNNNVDPLFNDALGVDGIAGTLDDDLRLYYQSPCIDAGNTVAVSNLAPTTQYPRDIRGLPRVSDHPDVPDTGVAVLGLTVDMGAFEFPAPSCRPRTFKRAP